ncbi:MAG: hypothetical protein VYB72_00445 [Planctomycetota bacterium]|nr:hypothetical protein [Planctomycetota bacterium]
MSAGKSNSAGAAVGRQSPETFPEAFSTNPEPPYVNSLVKQR